ncbi:MAG: tyrosine-type recombinase/integrase [Gammaproteobacteria bacterium]|nr:tyrosine-type recombinase/integrase [Gammaproteobacteria bacterium]
MARELTTDEINQVLSLIATKRHATRDKAIFMLALYSGLTIKEVVSLKISQVLTTAGLISEQIVLGESYKKPNRRRIVYLNKKVRITVYDYLCERFNTTDLLPLLLTDTQRPLFTTQKSINRGFTSHTLTGHFCELMAEAGVPDASAYSLRKSFAHLITAKVLSPKFIETMCDTEDKYALVRSIETNPVTLKKAINLI